MATNLPGDGHPAAVPDLIYPNIQWQEEDYARLEGRLDLFSDFLVLTKYRAGAVSERYAVDPAEVAAALSGLDLSSGLLPAACLFWSKTGGRDRLGVYVEPQIWPVTIRGEAETWRVPLPGLVFTGCDYNYSVWAVNERPADRRTPLYMAPCPNVHPEGVCRGNAPFPRAATHTIWQAVEVFFSSRFNRDLSARKSRAHPACVLDQWRTLNESGTDVYPPDDLVQTNITFGRLLDDELRF